MLGSLHLGTKRLQVGDCVGAPGCLFDCGSQRGDLVGCGLGGAQLGLCGMAVAVVSCGGLAVLFADSEFARFGFSLVGGGGCSRGCLAGVSDEALEFVSVSGQVSADRCESVEERCVVDGWDVQIVGETRRVGAALSQNLDPLGDLGGALFELPAAVLLVIEHASEDLGRFGTAHNFTVDVDGWLRLGEFVAAFTETLPAIPPFGELLHGRMSRTC